MRKAGPPTTLAHLAASLLLCAGLPAAAQSPPSAPPTDSEDFATPPGPAADPLSVSGSLSLVSDYRFRGISNSDIGPALQASAQLDTPGGLFLGLWGSTLSRLDGASTELDLSAGWAGSAGLFDLSAGAIAYLFPGRNAPGVIELFGTAGLSLGPATATLGLNWAPDQAGLARASRYAFAAVSAAVPGQPLTLRAAIGHEQGGLPLIRNMDASAKWDWQLGADLTLPKLTVGIAYVDTNLPARDAAGTRAKRLGQAGLLLKLSARF